MKRVRPGTVMIRVLAVFFALVSVFTSHRYFSEKSAVVPPEKLPTLAPEKTPTEAPAVFVLPSGATSRDAQLPASGLPADLDAGSPGRVLYVRVEAEQIASGSGK